MTGRIESQGLFADFPPISTDDWEAQIREDLRGADYGETMLWHTLDGYTLRPYYRSDDLLALKHLQTDLPHVEAPRSWVIRQDILTADREATRTHIRQALESGIQSIGLEAGLAGGSDSALRMPDDLEYLLEEVPVHEIVLHLNAGLASPGLVPALQRLSEERSTEWRSLQVTLGFDPIGSTVRTGCHSQAIMAAAAGLARDEHAPHFRPLCADAGVFHDAGATTVQETGLLLASLSEYFASLIEVGARASEVADSLFITTPIGSSYFMEIAKLRAIRILVPQVISAYHSEKEPRSLPIHAVTSRRNMTTFDPHMNLLRATTEASSAVIGGCDVLVVRPFDSAGGAPGAFSYRLARNIQLLLRHEAHLDRVGDPAAGSYYLEILTDVIARRAWQLFQEIEAGGGLLASLKTGNLHRMLDEPRRKRADDLAHARNILIGINHYPDPARSRQAPSAEPGALEADTPPEPHGGLMEMPPDASRIAPPLEPLREAAAFESLRLHAEAWEERAGRPPIGLVVASGDADTRFTRSNLAAHILRAGGFQVEIEHDSGESRLPADVVILAAPDETYAGLLSKLLLEFEHVSDRPAIGIVASPEVSLNLEEQPDVFLHDDANLLEILTLLHDRIELGRADET